MAAQYEVIVGANVTQAVEALKKFADTFKNTSKANNDSVEAMKKQLSLLEGSSKNFERVLDTLTRSMPQLAKALLQQRDSFQLDANAANAAATAMENFSRKEADAAAKAEQAAARKKKAKQEEKAAIQETMDLGTKSAAKQAEEAAAAEKQAARIVAAEKAKLKAMQETAAEKSKLPATGATDSAGMLGGRVVPAGSNKPKTAAEKKAEQDNKKTIAEQERAIKNSMTSQEREAKRAADAQAKGAQKAEREATKAANAQTKAAKEQEKAAAAQQRAAEKQAAVANARPVGPNSIVPGRGVVGTPSLADNIRNAQARQRAQAANTPEARIAAAQARIAATAQANLKAIQDKNTADQKSARQAEVENFLRDRANRLRQEQIDRTRPAAGGAGGAGGGAGGGGGSGGGGGGRFQNFLNDAHGGFFGGDRTGFGRSVGQAARFGLVYGSMYRILTGINQALAFTLTEAIDFQQGLTELSLATDRSRESITDLANNLADTANQYGLASREGIQTGTKAIGVFRALDSNPEVQDAVARQATRSVTQQAFLSGADTQELTANLAAITQAYGIGAESIGRVTDTMTFFEKNFGIAAGSLAQSMPAVAALFEGTGFTMEAALGSLAAVQSRTGQSPAAVSGLLSQILTREGEGTVQALFEDLGVVGDDLYERLYDLAGKIQNLSDEQFGEVASTFGKGRSQGAAIALIQELPRIFGLSERARLPQEEGGAIGLTEAQARMRLNDIGGQITQLSGAFKELARQLSQTGIIEILGVAVIGLRELAQTTSQLLSVWNRLPDAVQSLLIVLAAARLASPLLGGAAGAIGGRISGGFRDRIAANGSVGVRSTARAGLGAGLAAFGGPWVVGAIAGLGAISAAKGAFDSLNAASQEARDALTVIGQTDLTSLDAVRNAEYAATAAAEKRRDSASGSVLADPVEAIVSQFTGEDARRNAEIQRAEGTARILKSIADRLASEAQNEAKAGPFGDLSVGAVADGFQKLQDQGATAASAMYALRDAIDAAGASAAGSAALLNPNKVADETVAGLSGILDSIDYGKEQGIQLSTNTKIGPFELALRDFDQVKDSTMDALTTRIADSVLKAPEEARDFLREKLEGANADGNVTTEENRAIADEFFTRFLNPDDFKDVAEGDLKAARAASAKALGDALKAAAKPQQDMLGKTPAELAYENRNVTTAGYEDALSAIPDFNLEAKSKTLTEYVNALDEIIEDGVKDGKDMSAYIRKRNEFWRMADDVENQLKNQPLQLAASKASARAAGTADETDDLRANLQQATADLELLRANRGRSVQDEIAFQNALKNRNAARLALSRGVKAESAAIRDILGAQVGSELAAAISAVRDANAAMAAATTDAEKNAALIQQLSAQRGLRAARGAARSTARRLRLDLTNPVQVAFEDVRAIEEELADTLEFFRTAGSHGGKKVTKLERQAADDIRLRLRESRNAAKDTAFSQFLSDEQTDYDLGRQSRGEYLRDLKSRDNLLAVEMQGLDKTSNGYRALKEKRDQIAKIIKEMAEGMDAQFNLGDIDIPTPYQARRFMQQQFTPAGGPSSSNSTMITINGADTGQIIQILSQYVGSGNTYTAGGY